MVAFQESETDQLASHIDDPIEPGIDSDHNLAQRFPELWELSDDFKNFVELLVSNPDIDSMQGAELERFSNEQGTKLFHPFSKTDLQKIQDHGKIPDLNAWPESVALDDLMTQSALQSFTKDQNALDDRIRSFLK
ncbi:MAG: transaldolase, partial [Nitrospinaceae bacterium]|nr:transaldolase [Nitrospinaceae bacterium]